MGISYYREHRDRINAGRRKRYAEDREYREKAIQHARQYRLKNPEKVATCKKRWYNEHREKILEQHRIYYQEHKKEHDAYSLAWYHRNRKKAMAIQRRWQKRNRKAINAYMRIYNACRRAKKANARGYATRKQIMLRVEYYGGLCYLCGKPYEEIDHVVPLSKGGTNWPANLRPACKSCNSSKKDKLPKEIGLLSLKWEKKKSLFCM